MALMLLPNADKAILDIRKLREYTLNPGHLAGGNKARVFASCLGIGQQDAELPRTACLRAILSTEAIKKAGRLPWKALPDGFCHAASGKVCDPSHGLDHQDWRRRSRADKLLCEDIMKLLDVVALLEPIPEQHLLRG